MNATRIQITVKINLAYCLIGVAPIIHMTMQWRTIARLEAKYHSKSWRLKQA
jgi:hypothetical protein